MKKTKLHEEFEALAQLVDDLDEALDAAEAVIPADELIQYAQRLATARSASASTP